MTIKTSPADVWGEYEQGVGYNQSDPVNLYETVTVSYTHLTLPTKA